MACTAPRGARESAVDRAWSGRKIPPRKIGWDDSQHGDEVDHGDPVGPRSNRRVLATGTVDKKWRCDGGASCTPPGQTEITTTGASIIPPCGGTRVSSLYAPALHCTSTRAHRSGRARLHRRPTVESSPHSIAAPACRSKMK